MGFIILQDDSPMPFGKHKGVPMQDVPETYLHYLWHNGMKGENTSVADYIRRNMDVLKQENDDLIWDRSLI
jgi:uncharacterized protein (DUF3820 family)